MTTESELQMILLVLKMNTSVLINQIFIIPTFHPFHSLTHGRWDMAQLTVVRMIYKCKLFNALM